MPKDNPITKETLKKGISQLGIEGKFKNATAMEEAIDEYLKDSGEELEYECGVCGKSIPDVSTCPYCCADLDEEEGSDEVEEDEVEEDEVEEDEVEEDEVEEDDDEEDDDEEEEKPAKANKGKNKEDKKGKDKDKKKEDKAPSEKKQAAAVNYKAALTAVRANIGKGFEEVERTTGIVFMKENVRFLKVTSTGNIEFNVPLGKASELQNYTDEEAKQKHLGSCRAIYTGSDPKQIAGMLKEALKKFDPSKAAKPFGSGNKKEEEKEVAKGKDNKKNDKDKKGKGGGKNGKK